MRKEKNGKNDARPRAAKRASALARHARQTRFVRVKLDYVVRYDRELDGVGAFIGPDDVMELILGGLRGVLLPREQGRVIDVMPGARMSASLDFRCRGDAP